MNWLALDFETSDFNPYTCKIDRCCLIAGKHHIDVCWRSHSRPVDKLQSIINANRKLPLLAHNAKFELHLLRRLGIKFTQPLHDSMLMAKHYRNDYKRYALDALGKQFFDDDFIEYQELKKWLKHNTDQKASEFNLTEAPDELVHNYCMHDVEVTLKIAELCYPSLKDNYAYQLDVATLPLVQKMEAYGIKADKEFYEDFVRRGKRRVAYNLDVAGQELGTKGTNRKPTGHALREHLQSRGERRTTPSGLVRTGEVTLRDHKGSRAVRAVCRVRTDQKAVNTYAVNILRVANKDGFFHPNLKQSGAITRRFTSSGLFGDNGVIAKGNTQNFPRGAGLRDGIIVPDGFAFVKFDLASIEARLAAHAMSVFLDFDYYCKRYKADDKFNIYLHVMHEHTEHKTATKKDPIYTAYKHGVLGIQYGVGLPTFHRTMVDNFELPYSIEECKHIYETIRKNCPEFSALQRAVSSIVESQQFITDDFGAVYYVPEEERYKGVNYYCQGCAGNILKRWWSWCDKIASDHGKDYFFNTVHDELDGAIYRDRGMKQRIKSYCDTLDKFDMFNLPIRAETSDPVNNWGEAG